MSKDRYKWSLVFPIKYYEDIRDREKEAERVLQLSWVGRETGTKPETPGRQRKLHLKQSVCRGLELPVLTASLAQAVLKEVH